MEQTAEEQDRPEVLRGHQVALAAHVAVLSLHVLEGDRSPDDQGQVASVNRRATYLGRLNGNEKRER